MEPRGSHLPRAPDVATALDGNNIRTVKYMGVLHV